MIHRSSPITARSRLFKLVNRASRALLIALLVSVRPVVAQETLIRAKALYDAADYAEALKVLDAAGENTGAPDERQSAREYRALCLLALDRTDEMATTIERMVQADPFYHPAPDRTPRLLVMYDRIHGRLLPSIALERYSAAKANLEAKRYADSSAGFELVLRLIKEARDDSKAQHVPEDHWLGELAANTTRVLDGIRVAQQPPLAQAPPAVPQIKIYRSSDTGVTPPIPVRQDIPPWRSGELDPTRFNGELELLIGTQGEVREARVTVPIHPAYDPVILRAAAAWRYRPATKDGRPVAYYKSIAISLMTQKSLVTSADRP